MWVAIALQKLLTFFSKKFQHICLLLDVNFKESLTNDIVSFEQLSPVCSGEWYRIIMVLLCFLQEIKDPDIYHELTEKTDKRNMNKMAEKYATDYIRINGKGSVSYIVS